MTDKVVILVTAPSLRESKKIAKHLVEKQLAACVNVSAPIQSVYRWEGNLVDAKEFLLIIKSTRELFREVQAAVQKLHSYETPEIICLPIVDGSEDYLRWVSESLKKANQPA